MWFVFLGLMALAEGVDGLASTHCSCSRLNGIICMTNLQYKDCFDKVGRFPGEKYHIQLIDNPVPVIHAPRTVPVHILPLYKAELDIMQAEDIIVPVTEPTEWVKSIVCNVIEKPDGSKKDRLCIDPQDLNKNIHREHYYSKTIDEILPLLHGAKRSQLEILTKDIGT